MAIDKLTDKERKQLLINHFMLVPLIIYFLIERISNATQDFLCCEVLLGFHNFSGRILVRILYFVCYIYNKKKNKQKQ